MVAAIVGCLDSGRGREWEGPEGPREDLGLAGEEYMRSVRCGEAPASLREGTTVLSCSQGKPPLHLAVSCESLWLPETGWTQFCDISVPLSVCVPLVALSCLLHDRKISVLKMVKP